MDPYDHFSIPAIHGEAIAGRSATVRKQLIMLVGNIKQNTFDLMDLLMEAKANNYPAQWGFASVTDYGAQELGLKERKTQYLIRIGEVCKAVGLKRADYETAGVSKLRDICTLDPEGSWFNPETKTNEPLDEWIVGLITDAENQTAKEISEAVLKLKDLIGPDRPVVRSCSMSQSTWDNVVKVAYERVRMKLGSAGRDDQGMAKEYSDGACLECICADWLAGESLEHEEENSDIPMEEI